VDSESEFLIDPWIVNMYTVYHIYVLYIYDIFIYYIFIIHCIYRLPTIYHSIQVPSFNPTSMDQEAAALCIRQADPSRHGKTAFEAQILEVSQRENRHRNLLRQKAHFPRFL
jgi:hypothetical protein